MIVFLGAMAIFGGGLLVSMEYIYNKKDNEVIESAIESEYTIHDWRDKQ